MGDARQASLPPGWRFKPISSFAKTATGGTPSRKNRDFFGGTVPWVKSGELGDGLVVRTEETISDAGLRNSSAKVFPMGTLLMALYGATTGKVGLLDMEAATNQAVCAIFPEEDTADTQYLFYRLIHSRPELLASRHGGAQPNISQTVVRNLEVPLPPLPEQRAIANVLRTIQQAKEATENVIAAAVQLKQSLMRHLFTYGCVPFGDAANVQLLETETGTYPRAWSIDRFDKAAILQRGFDITKRNQRSGPIPVVSSGGIRSYHDTAKVEGPGVIIGRKGSLGTAYYVESDYWPHDTTLWVRNFKGNHEKFIFYLLQMLDLKTMDTGTSNPTLNRNYVHALRVGYPEIKEQEQVADIIDTVDIFRCVETSKATALKSLFETTLDHLMTGKMRIDKFPQHTPGREFDSGIH